MQSQLQMARDMIHSGFFEEARKILRQIDHPDCEKWLQQVDDVEENGQYSGVLFSDDSGCIVPLARHQKSPINSLDQMVIEMIAAQTPWDVFREIPERFRSLAAQTDQAEWLLFIMMVMINPFRLIVHWLRLQRLFAAVIYGTGYTLIFLALVASMLRLLLFESSPQSGALLGISLTFYIAFPFFMVFHQQRVYNRQRNIKPMRSYYGVVLVVIFLLTILFFFWLYSLSPPR